MQTGQAPEPIADLIKALAPYAPGVSGAMLGMMFAERLTVRGKLLAFATGVGCVLWVSPAVALILEHWMQGGEEFPAQIVSLIGFVTGVLGMGVLSGLAQAAAKYSRDPLALVRVEWGPFKAGGRSGDPE